MSFASKPRLSDPFTEGNEVNEGEGRRIWEGAGAGRLRQARTCYQQSIQYMVNYEHIPAFLRSDPLHGPRAVPGSQHPRHTHTLTKVHGVFAHRVPASPLTGFLALRH
jgi:hypothetical protein